MKKRDRQNVREKSKNDNALSIIKIRIGHTSQFLENKI